MKMGTCQGATYKFSWLPGASKIQIQASILKDQEKPVVPFLLGAKENVIRASVFD